MAVHLYVLGLHTFKFFFNSESSGSFRESLISNCTNLARPRWVIYIIYADSILDSQDFRKIAEPCLFMLFFPSSLSTILLYTCAMIRLCRIACPFAQQLILSERIAQRVKKWKRWVNGRAQERCDWNGMDRYLLGRSLRRRLSDDGRCQRVAQTSLMADCFVLRVVVDWFRWEVPGAGLAIRTSRWRSAGATGRRPGQWRIYGRPPSF